MTISLKTRRDQSALLLFHKIHCGAVYIEKDKFMTPARTSKKKTTRSSHSAQYCRYQTYSDALKNSFSPKIVCPLLYIYLFIYLFIYII